MRYSQFFINTLRADPKDETATNARLLLRGAFIDKLMAGSYTFLPLGFRVKQKIEDICREEMNAIGGIEILMPLLHPKEIWNETGRWNDKNVKQIMYQFSTADKKEYGLSFTHEEIFLDVARKTSLSQKSLPIKMYHFSTKFRNEARAKSGLLRGREFIMKDLYSLHSLQEDLDKFYWQVKDAYLKIFKRLGFNNIKVVEASSGRTLEFQLIHTIGEDTIYYCLKCDWAENKEIYSQKIGAKCPKCSGKVEEANSIEIANIFRFGTVYSEKMNVMFKDADGKMKPAYLGSYGIGIGRLMASIVEANNDDKGIIWPESSAPFLVNLVSIGDAKKEAEKVYSLLEKSGAEVLWDDRDESAGVKLADADLIGIPYRIIVSDKTLAKDSVEIKSRSESKVQFVKIKDLNVWIKKVIS
jgi:prolyl-tRNA synthetase